MTGRVEENNDAKREKVSEFVRFLETSKSTRIRKFAQTLARLCEHHGQRDLTPTVRYPNRHRQ
ncbi:hypothetical protein BCL69_106119 [Nitrosomonas communis]|uniref:Uncharacterized protein n=1 Tax=Nitrosomonas communis TaxID=44574 RepID=A0A5D3Y8P3_9PROT|nr:hypothetical protein BCL69_106119 [Nitrosomonas communis]